ncbi:transposase [Salinisphaera sp. Q1T1-3]|uniref:transposase n=1 Tax=Salinisphaera sp. Q1T1-3 TaxID=2321229 RepID=UPI000E7291D5|nr:transposase [Salinisphaera sp. Q1T1-3]RJS94882.1 hypothetical protein D3260_03745 [Salinisphaera sp. Q1T1-3]
MPRGSRYRRITTRPPSNRNRWVCAISRVAGRHRVIWCVHAGGPGGTIKRDEIKSVPGAVKPRRWHDGIVSLGCLAASCGLARESANEIARLYGVRMQIETAFRDLKSHQYGCAFEDTQTRVGARLEMLLLIHMLATLVAWLAALATRSEHETRFRIALLSRGWALLRQTMQRIPNVKKPPWQALKADLYCYLIAT